MLRIGQEVTVFSKTAGLSRGIITKDEGNNRYTVECFVVFPVLRKTVSNCPAKLIRTE